MSDIDRPQQSVSGPHVHLCSAPGCSKWGGHGFSTGRYVETRWWCFEHYPHKDAAPLQAIDSSIILHFPEPLVGRMP
jgi:hypothetical protein